MKQILTALALYTVLSSAAWSYTSYGAGSLTCAEFVDYDRKYGKLEQFEQWIWGYFTGRNYESDSRVGSGKMNALYSATLQHCKSNPLNAVVEAVDEIYQKLRR